MAISDKLTYLNTTKTKIREGLNSLGADLDTEDTFRSYADAIEGIYEDYPKITGEGTELSLDNTKQASMKIVYKGNTSQEGTPTPSSPIPVNVVSGDNTIDICGKNLLNLTMDNKTTSNITLTKNDDNSYKINGTSTGLVLFSSSGTQTLTANTTYTLGISNGNNNVQLSLRTPNGATQYVKTEGTATYATFTPTTDVEVKLYVRIPSGATVNETIYPMVVKGSTIGDYEPYIGKSYPIYLGVENIINIADGTASLNGMTLTKQNGIMTFNGTNTTQFQGQYISMNYTCTEPMTFGLNNESALNNNIQFFCSYKPSGSSSNSYININGGKTFATGDTINQFYIIVSANTTVSNYVIKPQLEKGTKANHFTPYGTTPIELCKIGTYQDYIYKDNGSWYLHKEIGKVVLDGSRNWIKSGNTNIDRFVLSGYVDYGDTNCFSNYFDNGVYSDTNYTKNQIFLNTYSSTKRIIINYSTIGTTTLAQFKTWLSTHNTIVYYPLATPINTLIENTTLIEQLEESKLSYISQTNISQINNDLPFNLDVKALRGE